MPGPRRRDSRADESIRLESELRVQFLAALRLNPSAKRGQP